MFSFVSWCCPNDDRASPDRHLVPGFLGIVVNGGSLRRPTLRVVTNQQDDGLPDDGLPDDGLPDDGLLELDIGAVAGGGGCVARAPDGRVVFVRHALPGERVRAQVTATASSYLRADAVEILRPSADRVHTTVSTRGTRTLWRL